MKDLGVHSVVASSGGRYVDKLKESGSEHLDAAIQTKQFFHPKLWFEAKKISAFCLNQKIQVIHAHNRSTQIVAAYVKLMTGIPFITTCHGFYKNNLGRRFFPAWGEKVVAISEGVRQDLIHSFGLNENRVITVNNAIDVKKWSEEVSKPISKSSLGFSDDDLLILFVARMVPAKGPLELLKAFREIHETSPHVKLILVGEGPLLHTLQDYITEHQLEESAYIKGQVSDTHQYYAIADLFAHPATWREAFGLSLIEAMASKLPIIMTKQWALYELLKDKNIGCFVENDHKSLVHSLETLVESGDLRTQYGQSGFDCALQFFHKERMAREVQSIYQNTLKEPK